MYYNKLEDMPSVVPSNVRLSNFLNKLASGKFTNGHSVTEVLYHKKLDVFHAKLEDGWDTSLYSGVTVRVDDFGNELDLMDVENYMKRNRLNMVSQIFWNGGPHIIDYTETYQKVLETTMANNDMKFLNPPLPSYIG